MISNKKILITQSNYIPWKGYFDNINTVDVFFVFDEMQYTKRDWRNRNLIKTNEGVQWLTIPVEVKGKYFQKINETKISDVSWGKKHYKTLYHHYSKSKHYKDVMTYLEDLFLDNSHEYLSTINIKFIERINQFLGIKTPIISSVDFQLSDDKNTRLIEICESFGANEYYSGPSAKNYLDEKIFNKHKIKVCYFDYEGYKPYKQLQEPFNHHVSILDLLFNEGKNAPLFMKSFNS